MTDQCIGWTWYLANDMQFFILSPLLVFAYCTNRKIGYVITILLIVGSMAVNAVLTVAGDVSPVLTSDHFEAGDLMYTKPWSRASSYFVGAIFGLSYFELSKADTFMELKYTTFNKFYNHIRDSRLTSMILFIVGVGLTATYAFPLQHFYQHCGGGTDKNRPANCWKPFPSLIYNMTSRPFFVIGVSFIIIPTFVGRLRIVKNLLSAEIMSVMARLSYMAYLIHGIIILWYLFDLKTSIHVSILNQWFFSIGTVVVSYSFAIPFTLLCEAPFMNLEKYILFPARSKSKGEDNRVEEEYKSKGKFHSLEDDEENLPSKRLIQND